MIGPMKNQSRRTILLDKLHRGFVNVCVATTVVTTAFLGYKIYEYIRYVRPYYAEQAKQMNQELLAEGKYIEDSAPQVS